MRSHPHRSYLVAGVVPSSPFDATFIGADQPLRSILSVRIGSTTYLLTGGEGHRVSAPGNTTERYRILAAFARDRLPSPRSPTDGPPRTVSRSTACPMSA